MIEAVLDADAAAISVYDEIIDVRSPAEFEEDHIPGAINLPVLDDRERAEIGTIYVQQSKFLARRLGAAHVSRNIAKHLTGSLFDKSGGFRPLVYCWRGGQRSTAMATVLSQVGWRTGLLKGGYKTYRSRVTARLYDGDLPLEAVILCGGTGSGKTALLRMLSNRGMQVVDLEALAVHRGSLFGKHVTATQPSQKMFESRLVGLFNQLDFAKPVIMEAESSRIGDLFLPPALWKAMARGRMIGIEVPISARAQYIANNYSDFARDQNALSAALSRLPRHHGRAVRDAWLALAEEGRFEELAHRLMVAHYDPAYFKSLEKHGLPLEFCSLADLSSGELERAATTLMEMIAGG